MTAAASPLPPPPPPSCDPTPETQEENSLSSEEQAKDSSFLSSSSSSSPSSLAAAAALVVAEAEAPLRWAPPRELRALRKLPQSKEMGPEQLERALEAAFERSPALREELGGEVMSSSSNKGGKPAAGRELRRCLAACLRSAALLAAGDYEQALRDARAAVARAPSSRPPLGAAASALLASSLEASGEQNSEALLEWLRCLSSDIGDLRRAEAKAAVERLRRRVPASHAAATAAAETETDGGDGDGNNFARAAALSLSSLLSREAQDLLPEVMKPRPKYYHYYKWTTKRIKAANGGTLPAPEVLRLLLASPAGDLDDVLDHPPAAAAAVARLTAAFERGGAGALEGVGLPRLTWREMREVQAWREGREVEADEESEARALEGGAERRRELPAPAAAAAAEQAGGAAPAAASAARSGDSGSEPELDLDALDF